MGNWVRVQRAAEGRRRRDVASIGGVRWPARASERGERTQAGIAGFGFETNLLISDGPGRQKREGPIASEQERSRRNKWAGTVLQVKQKQKAQKEPAHTERRRKERRPSTLRYLGA